MARLEQRNAIREVRQNDLAGGLNDHRTETLLAPNETPACSNVDFHRDAVTSAQGHVKLNNQTAPGGGILTRVDPAYSPLALLAAPFAGSGNGLTGLVEVPLRGGVYLPYAADLDIGGDFAAEGTFPSVTPQTFHIRRGKTFELDISFKIPSEEKLYEAPTLGEGDTTHGTAAFNPPHGFDEALDECFCIVQKGGDRTSPMSWALAVVNIGEGVGTSAPLQRASNYALVFMWLDAPQWGEWSNLSMRYQLTSGSPYASGTASYPTMAYRSVLLHKFVEPGRRYNLAVQLKTDTGTVKDGSGNSVWNHNGYFKAFVSEDGASPTSYTFIDSAGGGTLSGLEVHRGPTDSLQYLCKYGIRYSGRDAGFAGLGMRFTPWAKCGFLPFGSDCTPLRAGGFQMTDRSTVTAANLYGASTYTLRAEHTSGNAYVHVSLDGLVDGINVGFDPMGAYNGTNYETWLGLGGGGSTFNAQALRGYRLVTTKDWAAGTRGGIMSILSCTLAGAGDFRVDIYKGATTDFFGTFTAAFATQFVLVQCYRWHQRALIVGELRTWSAPRVYDDGSTAASRRKVSLRSTVLLNDETEPDIATLKARYPMDDAGGGVVREVVAGGARNGFLFPFANATSDGQVFLSGEGEAICLDLSENPIFRREVKRMVGRSSQGFGFEISFTPTEAFYAIQQYETLPDQTGLTTGSRPRLVPDLVVWDIKDATSTGMRATPRALLALTHRGMLAESDPRPFYRPAAFAVEVGHASDQQNIDGVVHSALQTYFLTSVGSSESSALFYRYDPTAPWVGRKVTIQVGVQASATADVYNVYIALKPKEAFLPQSGDPGDAEMAYWTDVETNTAGTGNAYNKAYFNGATMQILRKDLERSVLTIGGRWNCRAKSSDTVGLGAHELNARMLVDEVRWFGTSPSGALAAYSGKVALNAARDGKLEGSNALPRRDLERDDILQPLGEGLRSVNLTSASASVAPGGNGRFFTAAAAASLKSVAGSYLIVPGDDVAVKKQETLPDVWQDARLIASVAAGGTALTLASPYVGLTRSGAVAAATRLLGYTSFRDDVRDRPLLLGRGKGYDPTTTTVADVVLTDGLWANQAAFGDSWRLRIYSPLGRSSSEDLLPRWTRGLCWVRSLDDEDGILGLYGFGPKLYAGVRGALYEVDDRWRSDTPGNLYPASLAVRARALEGGVSQGLEDDRVEFTDPSTKASVVISSTDAYATHWDAWVLLEEVSEYQTILWAGASEATASGAPYALLATSSASTTYTATTVVDASAWTLTSVARGHWVSAGGYVGRVVSTGANTITVEQWSLSGATGTPANGSVATVTRPGHKTAWILRLSRGRPELVLCSTAEHAVGLTPEKGIFAATARQTIPLNTWTHIRFYLRSRSSGTILEKPWCKINGKAVSVSLNATDRTLSGANDWLAASSLVSAGSLHIYLGASRDSYRAAQANVAFSPSGAVGDNLKPKRLSGFMHSLGGRCSRVTMTRTPTWGASGDPSDFDPYQITYAVAGIFISFDALAKAQNYGVGHKIAEPTVPQYGVIRSHPFISVFHEMGLGDEPFSFTEYGRQLYAANGGKPVVVLPDGSARFAGTPSPTAKLKFTTERLPLWKRNANTGANNDNNDPIRPAAAGASKQRYHYQNNGVAFLEQQLGSGEMSWTKDVYFYFKCIWKPKNVEGRVSIWRKGDSAKNGGPFVECVDGRVRVGWWDIDLKAEQYVESTDRVFEPGRYHYIRVRKMWPEQSAADGNWQNSIFVNGQVRLITFTAASTGTFQVGETVTGTTGSAKVLRAFGAGATQLEVGLIGASPPTELSGTITGGTSGAVGTFASQIRPMHDICTVARFAATTDTEFYPFRVPDAPSVIPSDASSRRACISLTTDGWATIAGTNGTGLVTMPGAFFTGAALGVVNASQALFHHHMVGMYWIWGSAAGTALAGKRYLIITLAGTTQITCRDIETGNFPDFSSVVSATAGGVFAGVALRKSTDFDTSKSPDSLANIVRVMGTGRRYLGDTVGRDVRLEEERSLEFVQQEGPVAFGSSGQIVLPGPEGTVSYPLSKKKVVPAHLVEKQFSDILELDAVFAEEPFVPDDSEMFCPGWGVASGSAPGTNAQTFETLDTSVPPTGAATADPIFTGSDNFAFEAYTPDATWPMELRFDNARQFWYADGHSYTSTSSPETTQPNEDLIVSRSAVEAVVVDMPAGFTSTFTATTANETSGNNWNLSGVVAGDIAYTSDGFRGVISAVNDAGDSITVDGWLRGSSAGTPVANSSVQIRRISQLGLAPTDLRWRFLQDPGDWQGARFFAVAFYDPKQDVVGNPGPILRVDAPEDDKGNRGAVTRTTITNLPAAPGGARVRVYASEANGAEAAQFLVRELENGTASTTIDFSDSRVRLGEPLEFDNGEPPRCALVRSISGTRMVYGALEIQPDAIVPSKVGRPSQADYARFFRLAGGNGERLTGLAELDGLLVAMKRRALASITFDEENNARPGLVSGGVGCVAHQTIATKDNLLFFLSDRGPMIVFREGVTNLGRPQFVGDNIYTLFTDGIEKRKLVRSSACIDRDKSQYLFTLTAKGARRARLRVGLDIDLGGEPTLTRYDGPDVVALASVEGRDGGVERVVAGTAERFCVWMSHPSTSLSMLGPDTDIWGDTRLALLSNSTTTTLPLSGDMDSTLENWKGVPIRYLDADGFERKGVVLAVDTSVVHLSEPLEAVVPDNEIVWAAGQQVEWRTSWQDLGNPERVKQLMVIDLVLAQQAFGKIDFDLFAIRPGERGDAAPDPDTKVGSGSLDLTSKRQQIDFGDVSGTHFKLVVRGRLDTPEIGFELASLVWRVYDEEQV